jgi:peptide/nickel transport system substrate-binding protein
MMGRLRAGKGGLWALVVALGVGVLSGASATAQPAQRELKMAYIADVLSLDPAHFSVDDHIAMNIYNGLVRYQKRALAVEADLARKWEVSADGKTYTFYLRQGVQWHKGYGEFTARDVKYSLDRIKDPVTNSRYKTLLDIVRRVDVVDPYTVRITLTEPYPDFLPAILAWRPGWIVNKRAVDELGERFGKTPIGTGAYEVVSWRPRAEMVFKANERYFRGAPQIKNVRFIVIPDENVAALAMQKDEVNFMPVRGTQAYLSLRGDPNIDMVATPIAGWRGLVLNNTRKPLDDVRVRRALHHAVNRQSLLNDVLQDFGTLDGIGSPIPPGVWSHDANVPKFDFNQDAARRLLTEAGAGNVRLRLIFRPSGDDPAVAAALQQFFRRVGVEVALDQLEQAAYQARRTAGDYDMLIEGPSRAAPDQFLTGFEGREFPLGANSSGYKAADDLIVRQRAEVNSARRRQLLVELQKKIAGDVAIIQLWRPYYVTAGRKYVKNDVPNARWWVTWWEHMKIE